MIKTIVFIGMTLLATAMGEIQHQFEKTYETHNGPIQTQFILTVFLFSGT